MSKLYDFIAPSWVFSGSLAENIHFLHDKVPEIALLCFEPYLPDITEIRGMDCEWHLHLPATVPDDFFQTRCINVETEHSNWDNPWILAKTDEDVDFFAKTCADIFFHCAELEPWTAVFHCPPVIKSHEKDLAEHKLGVFLESWKKYGDIEKLCMENVENAHFLDFKKILQTYPNIALCLDIAHTIAYNQIEFIYDELMQRVVLMHWSAPHALGTTDKEELRKDRHLSLQHLLDYEVLCVDALRNVPTSTKHVLEIFSWQEIENSVPVFQKFKELAKTKRKQ